MNEQQRHAEAQAHEASQHDHTSVARIWTAILQS
jgi:hypothetical protein